MTLEQRRENEILFRFNAGSLIPMLIANIIFMQYYCSMDTFDNRSRLIMACGLLILAQLIQYMGILFGAALTDKISINVVLFNFIMNALQIMTYSYFLFVC